MALGDISHVAIDGGWLTDSLATKYTVPSAPNKVAIFTTLYFVNQDTTDREIEIQIIESGGSAGDNKRVVKTKPGTHLAPGAFREYTFANLLPGTIIQAKSDVASKISMRGAVTLKEVA